MKLLGSWQQALRKEFDRAEKMQNQLLNLLLLLKLLLLWQKNRKFSVCCTHQVAEMHLLDQESRQQYEHHEPDVHTYSY